MMINIIPIHLSVLPKRHLISITQNEWEYRVKLFTNRVKEFSFKEVLSFIVFTFHYLVFTEIL